MAPHMTYFVNGQVKSSENLTYASWRQWISSLNSLTQTHGIRIQAFVSVKSQFQLIATFGEELTLEETLSDLVTRFNAFEQPRAETIESIEVTAALITAAIPFAHLMKYAFQLPVRNELCELVEDWEASTIHKHLESNVPGYGIPYHLPPEDLDKAFQVFEGTDLQEWINIPYSAQHLKDFEEGIKGGFFEFSRENTTLINELNQTLYP